MYRCDKVGWSLSSSSDDVRGRPASINALRNISCFMRAFGPRAGLAIGDLVKRGCSLPFALLRTSPVARLLGAVAPQARERLPISASLPPPAPFLDERQPDVA